MAKRHKPYVERFKRITEEARERAGESKLLDLGPCSCRLVVETVYRDHHEYPLTANGWTSAQKTARRIANAGRLALVDLRCGDRGIALYQCANDHRDGRTFCTLESVAPAYDEVSPGQEWKIHTTPLAGRKR